MKKGVIVLVAVFALSGVGCYEQWKSERGRGDAPVGSTDDSEATVTNFPNIYPNVATKCINGADNLRVIVPSRANASQGTDIEVVEDASC